jgi:hypothetical protein
MPWKESRIVDQRLQFLSSYQKEEMSVSDLGTGDGAAGLLEVAEGWGLEAVVNVDRRGSLCLRGRDNHEPENSG